MRQKFEPGAQGCSERTRRRVACDCRPTRGAPSAATYASRSCAALDRIDRVKRRQNAAFHAGDWRLDSAHGDERARVERADVDDTPAMPAETND
jgi:hypothetical protein